MSVEELVKKGRVHTFQATEAEVNRAIQLARRDLTLAEDISEQSLDWCYSIAYNAVLQACRAFMGYRLAGAEPHKTTFEFMECAVDEAFRGFISYFDRVRKKRHRAVYDQAGLVTEKEARTLLTRANEFLAYVEREVGK